MTTLQIFLADYLGKMNLSAREFAQKCDLSHSVVNKILKHPDYRPAVDTIRKVSFALNLSPDVVFKMTYPEDFTGQEHHEEAELVADAFTKADEHVQDLVLKLLEIKVR